VFNITKQAKREDQGKKGGTLLRPRRESEVKGKKIEDLGARKGDDQNRTCRPGEMTL